MVSWKELLELLYYEKYSLKRSQFTIFGKPADSLTSMNTVGEGHGCADLAISTVTPTLDLEGVMMVCIWLIFSAYRAHRIFQVQTWGVRLKHRIQTSNRMAAPWERSWLHHAISRNDSFPTQYSAVTSVCLPLFIERYIRCSREQRTAQLFQPCSCLCIFLGLAKLYPTQCSRTAAFSQQFGLESSSGDVLEMNYMVKKLTCGQGEEGWIPPTHEGWKLGSVSIHTSLKGHTRMLSNLVSISVGVNGIIRTEWNIGSTNINLFNIYSISSKNSNSVNGTSHHSPLLSPNCYFQECLEKAVANDYGLHWYKRLWFAV